MHPVLLGPIKSFGFLLAVSFVVGIWLAVRRGRRRRIPPETVYDLSFVILLASIIGVRLFYVVTHLDEFSGRWLKIFAFPEGGLTLYGGLAMAILASWVFCRVRKLSFLQVADLMLPSVALGIGITRIGCFLAGCCYGLPCELPWAVHFPAHAPAVREFGPVSVHPAQLYSSAAGFMIFALLLWWERRSGRPGETLGRFLLLYGVARFGLDFTRYYDPAQRWLLGWSSNQWLSLGLVGLGVVMLLLVARRPRTGGRT
jgi:phosphatidylglycerol---prolipoprotein diacylglyceryl transferase